MDSMILLPKPEECVSRAFLSRLVQNMKFWIVPLCGNLVFTPALYSETVFTILTVGTNPYSL